MCRDPKFYSPTVTAVMLPPGDDADAFRNIALGTFNISYGSSFGPYAGKYFRIGHLGDVNDGMLMGALATTELALAVAGIPHAKAAFRPRSTIRIGTRQSGRRGGIAERAAVAGWERPRNPCASRCASALLSGFPVSLGGDPTGDRV